MTAPPAIEFGFEGEVVVKPDEFAFHFTSLSLTRLEGFTLDSDACQPINVPEGKGEGDSLALYVRPLVLQLIQKQAIRKTVHLDLVYSVLQERNREVVVVAYDVTRSGGDQLLPAIIDKVESDKGNVRRELIEFLQLWHSCRRKPDAPQPQLPPFLGKAGRVLHDLAVTRYAAEQKEQRLVTRLSFRDTVTVQRFALGEFIPVLLMPRFPQSDALPEHAIVLARLGGDSPELSREVWENLKELKRAISGDSKKRVLIRGLPGSGKEIYAQALHYGAVRPTEKAFIARSIANLDENTLRQDLFGQMSDGHHIPGLLHHAAGGSLFLDEFDKVHRNADGFYGELLRVLEAGEYVPARGTTPIQVSDVNWILAGAFSGLRQVSDLPPDLWTRLTHELRILNPIASDSLGYITSLFLYWVFSASVKMANGDVRRVLYEDSYSMCALRIILFDSNKPRLPTSAISAGQALVQFARNFANYGSGYWLVREVSPTPGAKDLPETAVFVPAFRRFPTGSARPKDTGDRNRPDFDADSPATQDARRAYRIANQGREPKLQCDLVYDGVRAVKQSTLAALALLYESAIKDQGTFRLVTEGGLTPIAVDALHEAQKTLDLSRRGEKAETVLQRQDPPPAVHSDHAFQIQI